MPLSKQRQAEYQRERRARLKAEKQPIPGFIMEGNRILGVQPKSNLSGQPNIQLYNPSIHKPGDRVLLGNKMMVIPDIDADGNIIPDMT